MNLDGVGGVDCLNDLIVELEICFDRWLEDSGLSWLLWCLHALAFRPSGEVEKCLGSLVRQVADDIAVETGLDVDGSGKIELFLSGLASVSASVALQLQ